MKISVYNGKFKVAKWTSHYKKDRFNRGKTVYNELPKDYAIKGFYVDRNHPHGAEIHWICSNGIILIANARTKRLVTKLIARPAQITRYYKACNLYAPKWLLCKCREHEKRGLNNV